MICCIYRIICLSNSKIYIGSAVNFSHRKQSHLFKLRNRTHKNTHLQYAFNKYGESEFIFQILEWVDKKENLLEREQYWLDTTKCYDREIGFNICQKAGSPIGVKRSDEFKEKIKQANLRRSPEVRQRTIEAVKKANIGRVPHNKGTKMWANKPHPRGGLGKKYPNRVITPEHYNQLCEINRRPKTKEYLEKRSIIASKNYYFIDPISGCELKIENLKQFCIRNGLNHSRMYQVAKGKEKSHKGWIREEICYAQAS